MTITSPLASRVIVRVPYLADMRDRLRACGGEPQWEPDAKVWTMPRRTLRNTVMAVREIFPDVRVVIEQSSGCWTALDDQFVAAPA